MTFTVVIPAFQSSAHLGRCFDERFRRPSIEDIELGGRLRRAGHRVWLCPDIQATHLKSWTFSGIITSRTLVPAVKDTH